MALVDEMQQLTAAINSGVVVSIRWHSLGGGLVYIGHFVLASLQELEISDTQFRPLGGKNPLLLYKPSEQKLINTEL